MADTIISLSHASLVYNDGAENAVHALDDATIAIERGSYVGLFGPSGSGKSTALSLIAGIERPDSGEVTVDGRALHTLSAHELATFRQSGIGIIFQQFNLIPSLTVLQNVALPLALIGISHKERSERAQTLLGRLGIETLGDRFPDELSGGQQQRVGIARALANDPPIVLADEPVGNLDSTNATRVLDFLKELHERDKRTIVMVTHEAWSLRDTTRIFYMRDGKIISEKEHAPESTGARPTSENHIAELHPEKSPVEHRVQAIATMLLRGYGVSERERLEHFLAELMGRQITLPQFEERLDRPYAAGGVGLWRGKAKRIAAEVGAFLHEQQSLAQLAEKLSKNPQAPLAHEVEATRTWLLQETGKKFDAYEIERLDAAISRRLRGVADKELFYQLLDEPKKKGGLGLSTRTAQKLASKLEEVLTLYTK